MPITLIAAMAKNRVIGRGNALPWRIKADMNRFMTLTKGHPVIMGRKTYDSLPGGKPLPNRTNIVLSRQKNEHLTGATVVGSLAEAIRLASRSPGGEMIMVIGGSQIFNLAMPLADKIELTILDTELDGDAYFPIIDDSRWQRQEVGHFEADEANQYGGTFYTYERTGKYPIVEPSNGRSVEYRRELEEILTAKLCPFCSGGYTWQKDSPLHQSDDWAVFTNAYPLEGTAYHFMILPKRHLTAVEQFEVGDWRQIHELFCWLINSYRLTGAAIYLRAGEPLVTGATVSHLHWQIIEPAEAVSVNFGHYPNL